MDTRSIATIGLLLSMWLAAAASSGAVGPAVARWRGRRLEFGLLTSFAAVQALDVVSTLRAVRTPGIREANPVMAKLVDRLPSNYRRARH